MNKLMIIGNLTRDPETRTTQAGKTVCTFTVAVTKRNNREEADFFRVSAWGKLGEHCQRFLSKGSKVAVIGNVSISTYTTQNGENRASLEVFADEIAFISPKAEAPATASRSAKNNGYEEVMDDDLPF